MRFYDSSRKKKRKEKRHERKEKQRIKLQLQTTQINNKKQLSKNQREYKKLRERIFDELNETQKFGVDVAEPDIFYDVRPERVTKEYLDEMQRAIDKYQTDRLYEINIKQNARLKTDDTMSNADWGYNVVENMRNVFNQYSPAVAGMLNNYLDRILKLYNYKYSVVAEAFQKMPNTLKEYMQDYSVDYKQRIRNYMTALLSYLPDLGTLERQQIEDAIDTDDFDYVPSD